MIKSVYLDYAATTPLDPEVLQEMLPYLSEKFGNPSSLYSCAKDAKAALDIARSRVARMIGAETDEIVFTGSGSEADNFALKGVAFANRARGRHLITSSIEHHAVLEACRFLEDEGFEVSYLPVDKHGMVSPDDVKKAIKSGTILISIMHANNEIGTIQPIREIGRIARQAGVVFHSDAVQTAGHLPIDVNELNVDLLSASAHKLYGPKGVGFLYVRKGTRLTPLIHGGDQEKGRRASTENVAGIVGLGKACEMAQQDLDCESQRLTLLRDRLIEGLVSGIEQVRLNGHPVYRLSNNINISFTHVDGESAVIDLDKEGICASTRSACNSNSAEPSHVLRALGLPPEQALSSLRFSLGKWTTADDIQKVLQVLPGIVSRLRSMSPLYKPARGSVKS
jgi:cysteine desulfurase